MNKDSPILNLFSECVLVKGYVRSVIYDLPRNDFDFIPNDLYSLLKKNQEKPLVEIKKDEEIKNYIDFLIKKEYAFFCDSDELELFPEIDLTWEYPSQISNLIVNIDYTHNFDKIKDIIEVLNTKSILLMSNNLKSIIKLREILLELSDSIVSSIEIVLLYNKFTKKDIELVLSNFPIIRTISFFSSPANETILGDKFMGNLLYMQNSFEEIIRNTTKQFSLFNVNVQLFSESQKHNTYFNRKLYIGPNGEIKNAPECEESFGNINEINNPQEIKEIIQSKGFQKYWFVHKELMDVCKDCEFRHMCVDNRIPHQRNTDEWFHKTECNYNPYICKWENEEGYRTLPECGVISNEHEFSIDHERIAEINKKLWEE